MYTNGGPALKVLIADDDSEVTDIIGIDLRINWPDCEAYVAADGEQALKLFNEKQPDLVILDIAMPPPSGLEVCRLIRRESDVPIIIVSGNASTIEKVRALDFGADDYITKPFDQFELLARLRANTRRRRASKVEPQSVAVQWENTERPNEITAGDLTLNLNSRTVTAGGRVVSLTTTECALLEQLVVSPGVLLSYRTLLERIWGFQYLDASNYLKVFVWRLRKKLEGQSTTHSYIQNVWGRGYRFVQRPCNSSGGQSSN